MKGWHYIEADLFPPIEQEKDEWGTYLGKRAAFAAYLEQVELVCGDCDSENIVAVLPPEEAA